MEKISLNMLAVPVTRFDSGDLASFVAGHSTVTDESVDPRIEQDYRIASYIRQRFPNLQYLEFFKRASELAPYKFAKLIRGEPLLGMLMEVYLANAKRELIENLEEIKQLGVSLALTPLSDWRDIENQPINLCYKPYKFGKKRVLRDIRGIGGVRAITMTDYLFIELDPSLDLRDTNDTLNNSSKTRLKIILTEMEGMLPELEKLVGDNVQRKIMPLSRIDNNYALSIPPGADKVFRKGQKTEWYIRL